MSELRELRKSKSLTLTTVADFLGISTMQMSRIERGLQGLKVSYAIKLGDLYGVEWQKFYSEFEKTL